MRSRGGFRLRRLSRNDGGVSMLNALLLLLLLPTQNTPEGRPAADNSLEDFTELELVLPDDLSAAIPLHM